MKLKVLLLSPPVHDFYFTPARREPLGLLYLKKSLENLENVEVDIYDATYKNRKKKKNFPAHFKYLKKFYPEDRSLFSLISNYYRFGDSFSRICEIIEFGKYDIVGVSSLFTGYHPDLEESFFL